MRRLIFMFFIAAALVVMSEQVRAAVINVAPFGVASQTSQAGGFVPGRAIDGIKTGVNPDFTHTTSADTNPTWTLDLLQVQAIEAIDIYNRSDCCSGRLRDITVDILDTDGTSVLWSSGLLNVNNGGNNYATGPAVINLSPPITNGQFVRINRTVEGNANDDQAVLALSEVEVFAEFTPPENIALGKAATQSSTLSGFVAGNATDGNLGNFTHTSGGGANPNPDWQVDLAGDFFIDEIVLFNRSSCCGERLRDITVQILDGSMTPVFTSALLNPENTLGSPASLTLELADLGGSPVAGSFVKVLRTSDPDNSGNPGGNADDADVLSLGEVQVFGTPVPEPSTFVLLSIALLGFCVVGIRRQRKN